MFATIGWALVRAVAVLALNYFVTQALAPRQRSAQNIEAVSSEEWNFPQVDEGIPQCVFFGDCWTEDWQVLAYGNYRSSPIKKG
ncbi:TPA: hypothetical protein ACY362_000959 [Pasteurella multocida]|uniref:hypothetical protein n=1 Tax=Pasteurella TaxID=745 RepID=UPI0002145494|nr:MULTISPECIES: hypothetical protein [Pasteurella]EGP02910.1 hypothetical protein AAUPMG_12191 [Pasteurella multocida subsp. multocida str. Anand1_goat]MCL7850683.1 hypothetical protein [Pasteurella multocida]UDW83997.1 hypothetical protein K7G91_000228 [Pasteurella canis]UEA17534.1 hypothetical protein K7G92_000742 [Pasteurella canis]UEA17807.1 hypothetical protein K7G92_001037 [Pasteurella canis]